ncbi:MAG: Stealth CR1 domain-containing protein [Lachnospiraceae bacterium]|nr:Stealth CR1 domain-containing protein [Lachnospiraceae bacterium]
MRRKNKVDIIVTWVDGSDPAWLNERNKYTSSGDNRNSRYRDWGLMPYWFRGIEKYAPWADRIFFVTWGHLPSWLNTDNPRLRIVNHKDYIPAEYLPTFNTNVIEMNLHRIKDLSENFVMFNDDIFLLDMTSKDFFFKRNKPCDMLALQPVVANESDNVMPYIYLNNSMILAKYFSKRQNFLKQPGAYLHIGYPPLYFFYNILEMTFPRFTGFYTVHGPAPLKKSFLKMIWEKETYYCERTCRNRFRSAEDVNQYLVREWTKLSGNFIPKNITKNFSYIGLDGNIDKITDAIRTRKAAIMCLNDVCSDKDYNNKRDALIRAFDHILPEKSSFEI